jgi:hypothetical protein
MVDIVEIDVPLLQSKAPTNRILLKSLPLPNVSTDEIHPTKRKVIKAENPPLNNQSLERQHPIQ